MAWLYGLVCWLRGHPVYSPTTWQIGWQHPRSGRFEHFDKSLCRRCGAVSPPKNFYYAFPEVANAQTGRDDAG